MADIINKVYYNCRNILNDVEYKLLIEVEDAMNYFVDPQGVQTHKRLMELNKICMGPRVCYVPLRISFSMG